jgi:alpha-mannosidase
VARDLEMVGLEQRGGDTLSHEQPTGRTVLNTVQRVEVEANDPIRTIMRIEGELAGTPVTQRLRLYNGLKRLDIENTVDWKQNRFMKLEQLFPYEDHSAQIRYGIPFGSAAGSDIMPNSGPHFGDEVPREIWATWRQIQDWVFAGNSEWGITISADRQLITLDKGVIRVGMLRGCYSTLGITHEGKATLRQVPPAGTYVFRYSLTSGEGDWRAAKSYRAGMAFSNPLIPVSAVDELSSKPLPPTRSFCALAADNLVVTALKKAERDDAIVLRVVEMEGAQGEAPIEFVNTQPGFQPANLLEAEAGAGEQQTLHVRPYEISTVRLLIKPGAGAH